MDDQLLPNPEPYISQINWLVSQGRDDLIDVIADEYELHRERLTAPRPVEISEPERGAA